MYIIVIKTFLRNLVTDLVILYRGLSTKLTTGFKEFALLYILGKKYTFRTAPVEDLGYLIVFICFLI